MATEEAAQEPEQQIWKGLIATTRPVRLRGEDRVVRFAREALDGMAQQYTQKFVALNYEHLEFVPPIGRINFAKVEEAEDGEFELHISGPCLSNHTIGEEPNVLELCADLPEVKLPELSFKLHYEPRNFEDDVSSEIRRDCGEFAVPVERWAALPPLEFAILIPVVWGATRFVGSFLAELGRAAGVAVTKKSLPGQEEASSPTAPSYFHWYSNCQIALRSAGSYSLPRMILSQR